MTNNKSVLAWLDEMKELVTPDEVVWIDGSEEQLESLRKQACETGEMIKLNEEKLPGCYPARKRTAAPPTTGWSPRPLTRCCSTSPAAATRAAPCT